MRAYSVFANEDSKSVAVNFSEDFLDLSYEERLDILIDASNQLKCIRERLIKKIGSEDDNE
jgi:hypothetical protein